MSNATRIIPITVGQYNDTAGMPKRADNFASTVHDLTEAIEYPFAFTVLYSDGSEYKGTMYAVSFSAAMATVGRYYGDTLAVASITVEPN